MKIPAAQFVGWAHNFWLQEIMVQIKASINDAYGSRGERSTCPSRNKKKEKKPHGGIVIGK